MHVCRGVRPIRRSAGRSRAAALRSQCEPNQKNRPGEPYGGPSPGWWTLRGTLNVAPRSYAFGMALTSTRLTADEYFALPPTEQRTQLINGEIVVTEASLRHQRIAGQIFRLLTNWLIDHPGNGEAGIPVDFHLDDHNVFAPDVWWVPEDARPSRDAKRIIGPP